MRMLMLGAVTLACLVCLPIIAPATEDPASTETPQQRDARMAWWREARFGMFVHWALYSGLTGTWEGIRIAICMAGSMNSLYSAVP